MKKNNPRILNMAEAPDRFGTERHDQKFAVSYSYPVCFTHDLFNPDNPVFESTVRSCGEPGPYRMIVYIDGGVAEAHPDLNDKVRAYIETRLGPGSLIMEPELVPGGERSKNGWNVVQNIIARIGSARLCRHSFVVAIGGGSVIDMVGFAASLVHRGIRMIRVPTTVLGQNDAGVGVKTGMDEHGMKNFVGTFAPPFAVLNDYDFLRTLKDKYWIGGLAEAFKVAIIKDADFFDFLSENAVLLGKRDGGLIEEVVKRTALLHLNHIRSGGDPFETGTARPLDFGHWAAHRLEVLSGYRLGHGQAVALGMALDCYYAAVCQRISRSELDRILTAIGETGLPLWDHLLEARNTAGELEIVKGLAEFREHLGGHLTITLPDGVGNKIEIHEVDTEIVEDGVRFLRKINSACSLAAIPQCALRTA
jgi:3-dehydroquinate synthase